MGQFHLDGDPGASQKGSIGKDTYRALRAGVSHGRFKMRQVSVSGQGLIRIE